MKIKLKPAKCGSMFDAFDILHGVNDADGTLWREYDLSARKRSAAWYTQEEERRKQAADMHRLVELAAKLPE